MDDLTLAARTLLGSRPDTDRAPSSPTGIARWASTQRFSGVAGFGYVEIVREAAARRLPARRAPLLLPAAARRRRPRHGRHARRADGPGPRPLPAHQPARRHARLRRVQRVRRRPRAHGHEMFEVVAPVYRGGGVPGRSTSAAASAPPAGSSACSTPSRSCARRSPARPASPSRSSASTPPMPEIPRPDRRRRRVPHALRDAAAARRSPASARPRPATALSRRIALEADGRWIVTVVACRPLRAALGPQCPGRPPARDLARRSACSLSCSFQVLARGRARALRMVEEKTGQMRTRPCTTRSPVSRTARSSWTAPSRCSPTPAATGRGLGDVHRPRRLQGRQRHHRPRGRRRAAARVAAGSQACCARPTRSAGSAATSSSCSRGGADEIAERMLEVAPRAVRPRHRQPDLDRDRASASPAATAKPPRSSCATPTSPSTRPRAPAATATPSSATRCTRRA